MTGSKCQRDGFHAKTSHVQDKIHKCFVFFQQKVLCYVVNVAQVGQVVGHVVGHVVGSSPHRKVVLFLVSARWISSSSCIDNNKAQHCSWVLNLVHRAGKRKKESEREKQHYRPQLASAACRLSSVVEYPLEI